MGASMTGILSESQHNESVLSDRKDCDLSNTSNLRLYFAILEESGLSYAHKKLRIEMII